MKNIMTQARVGTRSRHSRMGFISDVRTWWRWRMRRAGVHIPPFGDYRLFGTVVSEAHDGWRIEDDDGRTRFAQCDPSITVELRARDRVEIEPMDQSTAGSRLTNRRWTVVRKVIE
jgi:hypothetical protein